jgi:hypothetical protein
MHTIDDLHRALGEFLTACSRIENLMFGFIWRCDKKERDLETMFNEFSRGFGGWGFRTKSNNSRRHTTNIHLASCIEQSWPPSH